MNSFIAYVKKDYLEYLRTKKSIVSMLVSISCMAMVLLSTFFLPQLINLASGINDYLSGGQSLSDFMNKFFPPDLLHSMGIFSADISVFYSLYVVFITYNLLPSEITEGKIVLPFCAGHKMSSFLLSKELVYSFFLSVPTFATYLMYFFFGSQFLAQNYQFKAALINAFVMASNIFCISELTIILSILLKNKYIPLVMIGTSVIVIPDLMTYFEFGKYLPTYIITHLNNSSCDFKKIIIPLLELLIISIVLNIYALKKTIHFAIDERR